MNQFQRLKDLNDQYRLNLRLHASKPFLEGCRELGFFDEDEKALTIQVIQVSEDGKKQSQNLTRWMGCPLIDNPKTNNQAFTTNNGFENGNNDIIYQHYQLYQTKYHEVCERMGFNLLYCYSTTDYITFDVDVKENLELPLIRRLLLKYPFYLSPTKGLPKIIIPMNKQIMPPALLNCGFKQVIFNGTDVLGKGNMSYAPIDGHLFNTDFTIDRMARSDFRDCPLVEKTVPKSMSSSSSSASSKSSDYASISVERMREMLEFIVKCSAEEFPDDPHLRVGAVYRGEGNTCWLKICRALKDWDASEVGFEMLHEFSKKTYGYDESKWVKGGRSWKDWETCDSMTVNVGYIVNLYNSFREKFPPSATLGFDASNSKEKFLGLILEQDKDGVNHLDVGNFLLQFEELHKYRYSVKTKNWYQVNDETALWERKQSFYIGDFINRFVVPFLAPFLETIQDKDTLIVLKLLLKSLKMSNFQKGIMDYLHMFVSHDSFEMELNKNVDIISFRNGVYNVRERLFRPRIPSDFISITTNTDYVPLESEYVRFFRGLFRQIVQPRRMKDEDDKEHISLDEEIEDDTEYLEREKYLYKVLSFPLFGGNTNNAIFLMVGSQGENGKSTINELNLSCFGDYSVHSPNTWLTAKCNSVHGTSPIAQYVYVRYLRTSEPDASQKFNTSILKEITGDQVISARALYSENISYKPQFVPFVECNSLPGIQDPNDGGFRRRAKVVKFNNQFKNDNEFNEKDKTHKKQNPKLKDKLKQQETINQYVMFLLDRFLEYHLPTYPMKNLSGCPQEYEDYLKEYITDNNPVQAFFEERNYTFIPHNDDEETKKKFRKMGDEYTVGYLRMMYNETNHERLSPENFGKRLRMFAGKCVFKYKIMYVCYEIKDTPPPQQSTIEINTSSDITVPL